MRVFCLVAAVVWCLASQLYAQGQPAAVRQSSCVDCHLALGDDFAKPVDPVRNDVHGKRGLSCHSCHGGDPQQSDPDLSMDPLKGFIGKPAPSQIASFCGKCHSNAESMWGGSVHAEALLKKQDLSAPTCNDCHGNHGVVPAKTASVTGVCRTCHARQAEVFDAGAHKAGFEALGLPACVACHRNHEVRHPLDAMTGIGPTSVCITCHEKGEPGFETADKMHQRLATLETTIGSSGLVLDRASRAGMEVSAARFDLNAARQSLIDSRVVVHAFSVAELDKAIQPGLELARKAERAGNDALAELQYRRKGLAVALVIIGLAVISIYLKIREIERPDSQSTSHLEEL